MSLSIILTCYNETPMIFDASRKIISLIKSQGIDYEIIVVDDGSRPDVREELKAYYEKKDNVILIFSEVNEGRGAAVTKGINASTKKYVGFIDTDLEITEHSIITLYGAMITASADIVIGKRIYTLDSNLKNSLRYIASRAYLLLATSILKLKYLDTESGIKIFKKEKIGPVLNHVKEKRWFWDTEIIAESIKYNLKIIQIPIPVVRNKYKKSSVSVLRDAFRYAVALNKYCRRKEF